MKESGMDGSEVKLSHRCPEVDERKKAKPRSNLKFSTLPSNTRYSAEPRQCNEVDYLQPRTAQV